MRIEDKLAILADAAKYDVSCASSGSRRKNTNRRLGNASSCGICHTYTEDGRCVSLLKILYTNVCIYDCAYCINRRSKDIPRAVFAPAEIVSLTIDFYRRNYIEGLFLSSGILRSPDETMEQLVRTVADLRSQGFNGYIHLKCVPYASRRLIHRAGLAADRLSVNIELPSEASLRQLTTEKTYDSILQPMGVIRETIMQTRQDRKRMRHAPAFAPAGQSTQLIIGASPENDFQILNLADRLYRQQSLKRVYYSAYVPVGPAESRLQQIDQPPLQRENRLYQADWLMRRYGFSIDEIIAADCPHLDLTIDPKQAFARRHPDLFPVDINSADREMLLRVPGIGLKSTHQIVKLRRRGRIRLEHLKQLGVVVSRALPYIRCDGLPEVLWQAPARAGRLPDSALSESGGILPNSTDAETRSVFVTDGTFEGLLTAIFEAYAAEPPPQAVETAGDSQPGLFERRISIATVSEKSNRVWKGLKKHLGAVRRRRLFEAYLSSCTDVENLIYRFVRDHIAHRCGSRLPVQLTAHIQIDRLAGKVRREAHRMKGFVRFQHTGADRYVALIAPRYDVLPLIRRHFEARFADQHWILYDTHRNYGICYDRRSTQEVRLQTAELKQYRQGGTDGERFCQSLWQQYYSAANISRRNNPRLHLRQLPRRFWPYLPEKNLRTTDAVAKRPSSAKLKGGFR
jgi:probable DNA metabolism protein